MIESNSSHRGSEEGRPGPFLRYLLAAMIAVVLLFKLHLVFLQNVNWDEFLYLSYLYRPSFGLGAQPLMSFHMRLFSWLPLVGGGEIAQITAARLCLWVLSVTSAVLVYRIARRFFGRASSLYATLCFLCLTQLLDHGVSFRRDPLCSFLFVLAAWLLLRDEGRRRSAALAGVAMAVSVLLTPKVAIHLVALGALFLALLAGRGFARREVGRALAFGTSFPVAFAVLFLAHRSSLPAAAVASPSYLGGVAGDVLGVGHLLRGLTSLWISAFTNPLIWMSLLAGALLLLGELWRPRAPGQRQRAALVLALALPILSILAYRNTYPYFFVFILAPGIVLCGAFFERLVGIVRRRSPRLSGVLTAVLSVAVFSNAAVHYVRNTYDQKISQREHLQLIHLLFPEPVPYLDRCSMVSSYPKVGFFMSSWGMTRYQRAGEPVFARAIREEEPRFVLGNVASLVLGMANSSFPEIYRLLPEDAEALRSNYVHHWGALYVAGKTFPQVPSEPRSFEMLIAGTYTVESAGPVLIDGVARLPGEALPLTKGRHTIASAGQPQQLLLRWGDRLPRPAAAPTLQALFKDF